MSEESEERFPIPLRQGNPKWLEDSFKRGTIRVYLGVPGGRIRGFGIIEDHIVGKWRTLWYRFLAFLRRGQKEYCIQCLPSTNYYPYWLINTRRAKLKPVGECIHNGNRYS